MFADFHPKKELLQLIKISFMFQNVKSVIVLKNKNLLLHHFNSVILNVKVPQQQQNVYTICCGHLCKMFVGKIDIYRFASWPTNNKITQLFAQKCRHSIKFLPCMCRLLILVLLLLILTCYSYQYQNETDLKQGNIFCKNDNININSPLVWIFICCITVFIHS